MEPEWNNSPDEDDVSMLGLRPSLKISLSLEQEIDCGSLCNTIHDLLKDCVSQYGNLKNRLLTIEIKESKIYVPKLDHKN